MPGPPPVQMTKRCRALIDGLGPAGDEECQSAGVLVVTRHLDIGLGAPDAGLLLRWGQRGRARLLQQMQAFFRLRAAVEAGRTEEDDGVLNAFPPEARQRLLVFGQDAQDAAIGAVEEFLVLVGEWRLVRQMFFVVLVSHRAL